MKLDFNKTSGRDQVLKINTRLNKESQKLPYTDIKLASRVGVDKPNAPSRTAFYGMEIPKYYPGQPGFKKANAQEKQDEIESKKLVVDWKENPLTGQVSSARIKNIPGFESKNKPL